MTWASLISVGTSQNCSCWAADPIIISAFQPPIEKLVDFVFIFSPAQFFLCVISWCTSKHDEAESKGTLQWSVQWHKCTVILPPRMTSPSNWAICYLRYVWWKKTRNANSSFYHYGRATFTVLNCVLQQAPDSESPILLPSLQTFLISPVTDPITQKWVNQRPKKEAWIK